MNPRTAIILLLSAMSLGTIYFAGGGILRQYGKVVLESAQVMRQAQQDSTALAAKKPH